MKTKSTKKASKKNAAVPEQPRQNPEVQAAIGLSGVTVEGGRVNIAISLAVPAPTMQENQKWPYTQWNIAQLEKQVEKDLRRVAQTVANLEYVSRLVGSRAAAKAASKPAPAAVVGQAQSQGEQPTVGQ